MGKVTWLACVLVVVVVVVVVVAMGASACSVKSVLFEGEPRDGSVADTLRLDGPATDDPPIDSPSLDAPATDCPASDGPASDGPPPPLGSRENPANTCAELRTAGMPSAVYWLRIAPTSDPFEVYCEQQLNGGGWAMLENSVRRDDGTTTAFWQFTYPERMNRFGTPAPDQNYYHGALYKTGKEYMDVFVDLQDKTAVAAVMTATGFDENTMKFTNPTQVSGRPEIFDAQFKSGWSSRDMDLDPSSSNCAVDSSSVAQHYGTCWFYNLGSDGDIGEDDSRFDGGVGPHVLNSVLERLDLALQPGGGSNSQVKRIARFTRW